MSSVMFACNKASPTLYVYVRPWPVHLCHLPIPMSSVMPVTRLLPCYTCTYDHGLSTSVASLSPCPPSCLLVTRPLPCYTYTYDHGLSTSVTSLSPCPPSCLLVTRPLPRTCYTCTYDHGLSTSITSPSQCPRLRVSV